MSMQSCVGAEAAAEEILKVTADELEKLQAANNTPGADSVKRILALAESIRSAAKTGWY